MTQTPKKSTKGEDGSFEELAKVLCSWLRLILPQVALGISYPRGVADPNFSNSINVIRNSEIRLCSYK